MIDETEYLLQSPKNARRLAAAIFGLERSYARTRKSVRPLISRSQRRQLVRLAGFNPQKSY
jgi:PHD/YefM family antitoxin component YafN of YafNO toxin-antitoxin module